MTPSPGRTAPAARERRRSSTLVWALVMLGAALAGFAGAAPFAVANADSGIGVETHVAGINVERPSVEAGIAVPVTAVPPTVAAQPDVAPPTTDAPAPTTTAIRDASLRDQVLAAIPFPWQDRLPGWRIEFLPARPGYRGSTFPDQHLIQIYQRDGLTLADYVHVTAHELGHAVDVSLLDDADHERWNEARGRDADAGWWVASGEDDFSSGAGDWAEAFAWSQLPSGKFYSHLGPPPDAAQLAVLRDIVG